MTNSNLHLQNANLNDIFGKIFGIAQTYLK